MQKIFLLLCVFLSGCDYVTSIIGPTPSQLEEKNQVESKAVGASCRQINRNLEDCFKLNEKNSKRGIVDGWKEMDQYMRENNIKPDIKVEVKPKEEVPKEPEVQVKKIENKGKVKK